MCCIIVPFPHDFDEFVIVKDVGHGKTVTSFPPTPCFAHRVDAKVLFFRDGTLVPFVYMIILFLFGRC